MVHFVVLLFSCNAFNSRLRVDYVPLGSGPTKSQKKTFRDVGPQSPFSISSSFIFFFVLLPFFLNTKKKTSCELQVNGFFGRRPRWAGASEPCCTSSQPGLLTVGHLSPSPIGNFDAVDDQGNAVKVYHRPYSFEDGPLVYPANAFDSRLRGDYLPLGSGPTKSQKKRCLCLQKINGRPSLAIKSQWL